jgi:hypothetical protein
MDYAEPEVEEVDEVVDEPAERGDTFFIPSTGIPGSESLKAGETLTFRLVGRDADGQLEVEFASKPETEEENPMMDELLEAGQPDRRTAALITADEGAM